MRALASATGATPSSPQELVTKATNLTAEEAQDAGADRRDRARARRACSSKLDGFQVKGPKAQVLHTAGLQIEDHDMPLQYQLLEILVNPTVSYLLILLGLVGIGIELFSPGLILPGTIGAISLLLGLYGTAQLPVTVVGRAPASLGVAMIIAEAHLPHPRDPRGVAAWPRSIASGLLLYNTNSSAFEISAPVVIVVGLVLGGLLAFAVQRAVRARRLPVRTGWEEMVGAVGEVRQPLDPVGPDLRRGGAVARAARDGAERGRPTLERGSRVRVESVEGLTLHVRPLESAEERRACRAEHGPTIEEEPSGSSDRDRRRCRRPHRDRPRWRAIRILREYERGVIFRLGRLIAQKGPGADPPDPVHRPDGQGRPADGDAERAAAGGDHEGQRHRAGQRGRLLPGRSTRTRRSPRSRTSCSPPRRSRRRRCARCSARPSSTRCSSERERLNVELQQIIDEQTEPWGVKVTTVEVKDVELPADMQRAIARQAEAERERRAKIIAADGEFQAAEKLSPGRQHHQPEPGDAPAPLPADAARDRGQPELDDHLPAAARPDQAVPRLRPRRRPARPRRAPGGCGQGTP